MKTNHQRQFTEKRKPSTAGTFRQITDGGKLITAWHRGNSDYCCGKRGQRRDRAGAKKFVNSRTRFHNKAELKKLIKDIQSKK